MVQVYVKTMPVNDTNNPAATRLQYMKPPKLGGKTLTFEVAPTDTVGKLKKLIAEKTGEVPEELRKGGCPQGFLMADTKKLSDYGLTQDMSIHEHLWLYSAVEREGYAADHKKLYDGIETRWDYLRQKGWTPKGF
eukprot:CAMPEP_0170144560 /NCGR_PEP_ID=MMETSP0033_2-20121228/14421_1 /TAXON_ID=195969 /ORGANISM="Dolichomastix tenuilepis, Strain CCMP3274" /LENGTH=134 /DNA_ID=CAMNT_0010381069 /DNA_START=16 /DNA_END=420 /DNA_ORIENTATION=+